MLKCMPSDEISTIIEGLTASKVSMLSDVISTNFESQTASKVSML